MSAGSRDAELDALRARRDALLQELRALGAERAELEDALILAQRGRLVREDRGPDSAGVHLRGVLRDLARHLDDARRERARALAQAQELAASAVRAEARRRALESLLARMAAALER